MPDATTIRIEQWHRNTPVNAAWRISGSQLVDKYRNESRSMPHLEDGTQSLQRPRPRHRGERLRQQQH